jgi:hypothetical protein
MIFVVQGQIAVPLGDGQNEHGGDWKYHLRKDLGRHFPGIQVDSQPHAAAKDKPVEGVHGAPPRGPLEEEVAQRVIQRHKNRKQTRPIEWLRWGPHDLDGRTHYQPPETNQLVRVRIRVRPADAAPFVEDLIFTCPRPEAAKGAADAATYNPFGDDWIKVHARAKEAAVRRGTEEKPAK